MLFLHHEANIHESGAERTTDRCYLPEGYKEFAQHLLMGRMVSTLQEMYLKVTELSTKRSLGYKCNHTMN